MPEPGCPPGPGRGQDRDDPRFRRQPTAITLGKRRDRFSLVLARVVIIPASRGQYARITAGTSPPSHTPTSPPGPARVIPETFIGSSSHTPRHEKVFQCKAATWKHRVSPYRGRRTAYRSHGDRGHGMKVYECFAGIILRLSFY